MKKRLILTSLFIIISVALFASPYYVYDLTCEQAENPVGVDVAKPFFSWKMMSAERNVSQSAYEIIVSDAKNAIEGNIGNIWDSGKVNSSQSILVVYGGKKLSSFNTYYWKVRSWNQKGEVSEWSGRSFFTMGILSAADWKCAKWISMEKENPINRFPMGLENLKKIPNYDKMTVYRMPQFRKEFAVNKPIKKALAYVSGVGQFEMFLNGKKVGNHLFDPGWTNYDSLALYVSFDVTKMLVKGSNAVGVMLGGGFYCMSPNDKTKRYLKFYTNFGAPKMILNLHIEYEDGTSVNIVSDKTWKAAASPVTYAAVYGGEDYDATLYQEGWMKSGFKEKGWNKVLISDYHPTMASQQYDPITVRQVLPTRSIFNSSQDWVYDLGQNASGTFRLKVSGKRGDKVIIRPGELLKPDSSITQRTCGGNTYFTYILKGDEEEVWIPQFTYYGFRYLSVTGAVPYGKANPEGLPQIKEIVGLHTCNSASEAGSFTCSNQLFNKTHELIDWAIRSNMSSVLTDCPHRERLGWLEESHLMQYSLQYRYNLSLLYKKIMRDMQLAQTPEGIIPSISPEYSRFKAGFENSPEWGSTFVIAPYYYYLWYGDKRLLEQYYPYMQKYLDYLTSKSENYILSYGLGDWYDIGPKKPGYSQLTSYGVTATSSYYYEAEIMQKVARLMGKDADAEKYGQLVDKIRYAFNKKYFHADSCYYDRNSQTANALPIFLGIVEPQYKQGVLNNLVNDIRKRGNAITAGDIGYRYVLKVLSDNNLHNVIYDMNSRYDVPGYGYQLAHGATALTEAWNAQNTSSQNHFMLGHIMEWLYSGLGGIRPDEETIGFKHFVIDPQKVGDVNYANTSYESPYGKIQCDWKQKGEEYILHVIVPVNSSALIILPTDDATAVSEYGQPLSLREDIKVVATGNNFIKLNVGSGDYLFKVSLEK